jgi:hypothetical protein
MIVLLAISVYYLIRNFKDINSFKCFMFGIQLTFIGFIIIFITLSEAIGFQSQEITMALVLAFILVIFGFVLSFLGFVKKD